MSEDIRSQIIKGRYRLQRVLGAGGMATAYLAQDQMLRRPVVVKLLQAEKIPAAEVDTVKGQFLREARSLAALDHAHILRLYEFGEYRAMPFMVVEYLPNGSLSRRMAEFNNHQAAARLLIPIAEALHYAHSRAIVHRDVKPDNILFGADDAPKLSDFGIAALIPRVEVPDPLGRQDVKPPLISGTPQYMAPECWRGEISSAADQYALGVVLYELLCAEWPFVGATAWEYGDQHLEAPIPSLRKLAPWVPQPVEDLVTRMLAKQPAGRYPSLEEAARALHAAAELPLSHDQPRTARASQRRPFLRFWRR